MKTKLNKTTIIKETLQNILRLLTGRLLSLPHVFTQFGQFVWNHETQEMLWEKGPGPLHWFHSHKHAFGEVMDESENP